MAGGQWQQPVSPGGVMMGRRPGLFLYHNLSVMGWGGEGGWMACHWPCSQGCLQRHLVQQWVSGPKQTGQHKLHPC